MRWVYPRVCGGTRQAPQGPPGPRGLSPRVRGNLHRSRDCPNRDGSIPACAGEPARQARSAAHERVYPRVCGGTAYQALTLTLYPGLSPRVRGNPEAEHAVQALPGSIPACAGEPTRSDRLVCGSRVYPRVCGGTLDGSVGPGHPAGLSPRVRGNPAAAASSRARSWVYPRVCGGTAQKEYLRPLDAGLSPRVRGNPEAVSEHHLSSGSIPACAGEPKRGPRRVGLSRVYPRVCGGTRYPLCRRHLRQGLSPRVRGNL